MPLGLTHTGACRVGLRARGAGPLGPEYVSGDFFGKGDYCKTSISRNGVIRDGIDRRCSIPVPSACLP